MVPIARGDYLLNRDGTCDYGEVTGPAEIDAREVPGKGNLIRTNQGGEGAYFQSISRKNARWPSKNGFGETKSNFGKPSERKQNSEKRQSRFSKAEYANMNGGCEQRGPGRGQSMNRPACFECGNTDLFKDQWHIWIAGTKRWTNTQPPSKKKGGKARNAERLKKVRRAQLCILS